MEIIKTKYSRIEVFEADKGENIWIFDKNNNFIGCIANHNMSKKGLK